MLYVQKQIVSSLVEKAIPHLAFELPKDVVAALITAAQLEKSQISKSVLEQLCTNADIANKDQVPICQDTGSVRILLQIGHNVSVSGDVFEDINNAVSKAYKTAKLRKSMVNDAIIDRSNTKNNTPAFCEIETINKPDIARLHIMLKGGGSDNASRVDMLVPGNGKKGVINTIVKAVQEKAAAACPPLTIGIGIGSSFDHVANLAQKALFRPIGTHNRNAKIAKLETEILEAINATQIGPGALGGTISAMQVNILSTSCHIASMPLAIDMGCCALRRISIDIPFENTNTAIEKAIKDALNKNDEHLARNHIKNIYTKNKKNIESDINKKAIKLNLPLKKKDLEKLSAGDKCLLSGTIFTLRDAGHIRLLDEIKDCDNLPYNLDGQIIYYAGPSPEKQGRPFGAIGPTTATRMDFATPQLYKKGLVATIGKGKRDTKVHQSCKENNTVYFVTIGGCAAYLAKCVKNAKIIAYEDLGTEALRKLEVENFPVFVGIDTNGNDIYK